MSIETLAILEILENVEAPGFLENVEIRVILENVEFLENLDIL